VTSNRLPYAQLAVLATILFASVLTEIMPVGLLPLLSDAFHVSEERVGWWMSAYALIVALTAIPLTAALARWPRRTALLALLAVYAASNLLILVAPGFWVGLAGRVVGGVAHAGIFSVAFAGAAALAPPGKSGRAVALVNAGVAPALAFGLPAATAAGTAWGWRWPFAATAVIMLLLAVATWRLIPASIAGPAATGAADVLSALRGRGLQMVGVLTVVLTVGHYTAYTYVAPMLLRAGVPQNRVGLVLLGYGVAGALGMFLAGAFVDRRLTLTLRLAIALAAASLLAMAASTGSGPRTSGAVLVWGVAFSALPILLNAAALRASSVPDAAPAVVNAMFNVGIASGAWLGGQALSRAGPAAVALTGAALVAASLLLTRLRSPGGKPGPVAPATQEK
jgi:DHA1 family inner membrane transport protein